MNNEILIVDDAIFMRRIIKTALIESGFENIQEAKDGEEAVRLYKSRKPDIVLLDITMPGKSGIEVLEEIREEAPDAVVIMCSAIGQEKTIEKAVRKGASGYIIKPFKKEELAEKIRKYL